MGVGAAVAAWTALLAAPGLGAPRWSIAVDSWELPPSGSIAAVAAALAAATGAGAWGAAAIAASGPGGARIARLLPLAAGTGPVLAVPDVEGPVAVFAAVATATVLGAIAEHAGSSSRRARRRRAATGPRADRHATDPGEAPATRSAAGTIPAVAVGATVAALAAASLGGSTSGRSAAVAGVGCLLVAAAPGAADLIRSDRPVTTLPAWSSLAIVFVVAIGVARLAALHDAAELDTGAGVARTLTVVVAGVAAATVAIAVTARLTNWRARPSP